MKHLFTSESVSEGHPDKMADQISDALLDNYLAFDKTSKVACETLVTTGQVVVAGEIKTNSIIDHDKIIRNVIDKIGYNKSEYQFDAKSCGIFLHYIPSHQTLTKELTDKMRNYKVPEIKV